MKKPAPIQLSIPQTCTQAWEEMQPVGGGRHCDSCKKVVTDFSRMTDAQLLDYFRTANGASCGRFRAEQLDRMIQAVEVPRSNWWARIAAGLLLVLGIVKSADGQSNNYKSYQSPVNTDNRSSLTERKTVDQADSTLPKARSSSELEYIIGQIYQGGKGEGLSIGGGPRAGTRFMVESVILDPKKMGRFPKPTAWERLKIRMRLLFR